jgi:nucleotide-binding universal stress UspA family protein
VYDAILFPTDGSRGAQTVADHVGTLAETHGATVHALSVVDARNRFESPSSGIAPDAWEDHERERAEQAVDDAVAALPEAVETERHVESGVPHTAILDCAAANDVDLVVMGTHGRTGLDHYLIGSVAERVVRQSPAPVLTVRIENGE